MRIKFSNTFLHITAIGTLILTLITDSLIYPFILGSCLGQFIYQDRKKRNEEL